MVMLYTYQTKYRSYNVKIMLRRLADKMNIRIGDTNHLLSDYGELLRHTKHKKMQNEPNFKNLHPLRHRPNTQTAQISPQACTIIYPPKAAFQKNSKKLTKKPFCKFHTLKHLTPCTTKTYINISTHPKDHGQLVTSHKL